jgi:hypothetical protein
MFHIYYFVFGAHCVAPETASEVKAQAVPSGLSEGGGTFAPTPSSGVSITWWG